MTLFIGLTIAAAIALLFGATWALVHYGSGVVRYLDVMGTDPKQDPWAQDLERKQREEAEK